MSNGQYVYNKIKAIDLSLKNPYECVVSCVYTYLTYRVWISSLSNVEIKHILHFKQFFQFYNGLLMTIIFHVKTDLLQKLFLFPI